MGRGKKEKKESDVFSKETIGMVLILFSTLALVCLFTRELVFSAVGQAVNGFLFGVFGWFAFPLFVWLIVMGVYLVCGRTLPVSGKNRLFSYLTVVLAFLLIHAITSASMIGEGYGAYLSACYAAGDGGVATATGGGWLFGLLDGLFLSLITPVGSYVLLSVLIALTLYGFGRNLWFWGAVPARAPREKRAKKAREESPAKALRTRIEEEPEEPEVPAGPQLYYRDDNFELKTRRQQERTKNDSFRILYPNGDEGKSLGYSRESKKTYSAVYGEDMESKLNYIKTPSPLNLEEILSDKKKKRAGAQGDAPKATAGVSAPIREIKTDQNNRMLPPAFDYDDEPKSDTALRADAFAEKYASPVQPAPVREEPVVPVREEPGPVRREEARPLRREESALRREEPPVTPVRRDGDSERRLFFGEEKAADTAFESAADEAPEETNIPPMLRRREASAPLFAEPEPAAEEPPAPAPAPIRRRERRIPEPVADDFTESQDSSDLTMEDKARAMIHRVYKRPPIDLFKIYKQDPNGQHENHEERSRIIERTLSEFNIDAKVVNCVQGPTVSRYELMMPAGIPVKRVPNHADDVAMRLESENGVRVEAPIPGKNLVGIEVPNKVKQMVGLRDIIEDPAFTKEKPGALTFALGKNIVGQAVCDNLAKGPHYLVAGSTGMGKSVCLNTMIISLITKYSPEELRLIMVDPKQVEFNIYNHLPHLMIDEIITEPQKAIATLTWAIDEMEKRYTQFKENEVRDIDEYNSFIASDTVPKMPKIVIIVDEVSDLMMYNKRDLEAKILSLSQKARAAGIHLVLATQRPSVDVITGVIKTNLPSRIAFRVLSAADSMTILSEGGAEKLLGNGDMLYRNASMAKCERIQGAFIDTAEVKNIVNYIKENNEAYFDDEAAKSIEESVRPPVVATEDDGEDDEPQEDKLFIEAVKYAVTNNVASISMFQRRFKIGYGRAGGLIDSMERLGYVSPFQGSKAREVLITREQFEEKYGKIDE